jgi:hypothetical protein
MSENYEVCEAEIELAPRFDLRQTVLKTLHLLAVPQLLKNLRLHCLTPVASVKSLT